MTTMDAAMFFLNFAMLTLLVGLQATPGESRPASGLEPICCFPMQYEAFMVVATGAVNTGQYGHANGTVIMAFDGVRQLTFFHEDTLSVTTSWPIPIPQIFADILDYESNVQWRVYADESCDTLEVGLPLYQECIPGNATLIARGSLGDSSLTVATFLFRDRIYLDPYEITITVHFNETGSASECVPVRGTISSAYVFDSNQNVDIATYDVLDFTRGIRDAHVFNKPDQCAATPPPGLKQGSTRPSAFLRGGLIDGMVNSFQRRTNRKI